MRRGFTLIELLVVLVILGLLMAALGLNLGNARRATRDTRRLGDVLLIAKAIDQSIVANAGRYPKNVSAGGNQGLMCANQLVQKNSSDIVTNNPSNLDLTLFPKRIIPQDPAPYTNNVNGTGCVNFRRGYTYHTQYGAAANSLAIIQNTGYTLEVGLEREKPIDETAFHTPAELNLSITTVTGRFRYLLNGKLCSPVLTERCY